MKIKVGTQLDDEVYRQLKIVAAREKRPIGEIIQHALSDYIHRNGSRRRGAGLNRMLSRQPLKISDAQFKESLELDYFDQ